VPDSLFGILRHQRLELGFGPLMLEKGLPGIPKQSSKFPPGIRGAPHGSRAKAGSGLIHHCPTEILQDNLPEDDAEDRPQRLALDCAINDTDAVDSVNEILSSIDLTMGRILNDARDNRPKSSLRNTGVANLAPSR
jgi:hypothetical protein